MSYECNIFKQTGDTDCSNVVSVVSVLKAIKSGKWKAEIEKLRSARDANNKKEFDSLKYFLTAVIWSGVFEERLDDACVVYNGLMVIDIDKISQTRLKRLKKELIANPYVFAFFDGPSKGLKILMFVDSDRLWHNTHAFYQIETMFIDLYGIEVDPSGKNLSRLCYVSYDPDLYINYNPLILHIEEQKDVFEGFSRINPKAFKSSVNTYDARHILDVCSKMVKKSKTGGYHKGNRNNFIFSMSCLACEFGINPEMTLLLIFDRYPSLGHKEIKTTVESAYKRNHRNFGTREINNNNNSSQTRLL
jgi:VirE N-terminal domain/Primase C terminal 1 (PriCT-1)